jgi:hypothetical protein
MLKNVLSFQWFRLRVLKKLRTVSDYFKDRTPFHSRALKLLDEKECGDLEVVSSLDKLISRSLQLYVNIGNFNSTLLASQMLNYGTIALLLDFIVLYGDASVTATDASSAMTNRIILSFPEEGCVIPFSKLMLCMKALHICVLSSEDTAESILTKSDYLTYHVVILMQVCQRVATLMSVVYKVAGSNSMKDNPTSLTDNPATMLSSLNLYYDFQEMSISILANFCRVSGGRAQVLVELTSRWHNILSLFSKFSMQLPTRLTYLCVSLMSTLSTELITALLEARAVMMKDVDTLINNLTVFLMNVATAGIDLVSVNQVSCH